MTENDYIAEYVKEKFPQLLCADFAFWKFGRQISNVASQLADAFKRFDIEQLEEVMEEEGSEEE